MVAQHTHVFITEVPKGALLEVFSDGTHDNLGTATPAQAAAAHELTAIIPLPGRTFNRNHEMTAEQKAVFRQAIEELVEPTNPSDSALRQDIELALESLDKDNPVLEDNQKVYRALAQLFQRDMERSLEAIYSNPHLDHLTPTSELAASFPYIGIPRHRAIADLRVVGADLPPSTPLTPAVIAQRKANLLQMLTQPLRDAQSTTYRFERLFPKSTQEHEFEGYRYYDVTDMDETTVSNLLQELTTVRDTIDELAGPQTYRRPLDFTVRTFEVDGQPRKFISADLKQLLPRKIEGALGVKVDDVHNGVVTA